LLPTFFIIGAARAATTTLWSILSEHPSVYLPSNKEPNYFLGGHWARKGLAWYESLYASAGAASHRGEASTGYSMFPIFRDVPERTASIVPEARIIYAIRHPVDRMVSQWAQGTTRGREHRPLEKALVWESLYYFCSCYGLQLTRWRQAFSPEAILVVRSEDLAGNPGDTIDRILAHLGLPVGWRPSDTTLRANATDTKLRAPLQMRRIAGALHGAGLEHQAWALSRGSRLKESLGLMKPFHTTELQLAPDLEETLRACLHGDFKLLRELVGPDMDLYGIA
jgi:Sulfotransferase family